MTIQDFNIYTANGYEGDLVDSGPRVVQTGILVGGPVGFGKAVQRNGTVDRGIGIGTLGANIYAITQREYNHEAGTRPSTGNDTVYLETESVSLIRQGFLYVKITDHAAVAGEALVVDQTTGLFVGGEAGSGVVAGESIASNVFAEEAGIAGDVIKVRIDIVA